MKEAIQWTAPSPLWENALGLSAAVSRRSELNRPSILRFATDDFMDVFLRMLSHDPQRLNQFVAFPETWRGASPPPETIKPAPAFARNFQRLGLIAARKKTKRNDLTQTNNQPLQVNNLKSNKPLKLYQPAHQRFYLLTAHLVCERPGLPDKIPNGEREEKVSFVMRRLFPPGELDINTKLPPLDSSWEEYAFVQTDQGAKWKRVENNQSLLENEEQQPLFAVNFNEDDGRRRKLFSAVIPAGRREAYMAAGKSSTANIGGQPAAPPDSRVYLMRSIFRDPWKNLLQTAAHAKSAVEKRPDNKDQPVAVISDLLKVSREQIQTISWLILLDFANFLADNLPRIWNSLNGAAVTPALNNAENVLVSAIANTTLENDFAADLIINTPNPPVYTANQVKRSLKAALLAVRPANEAQPGNIEKNLEKVVISYDRKSPDALYPKFLFPLADAKFSLKTVLDGATVSITPTNFLKTKQNETITVEANKVKDGEDYVNRIAQLVEAALPPAPPNQAFQPIPLAAQTPLDMREGWFLMRCVYERPLCGAIDPPILSDATEPFQIAGFFDPDAPARPIRIGLPIDTTPAGLRKFDKNTAFMMSDLLCGQVNRMKGITFADLIFSILPFPFHKGLDVPDTGGCKDNFGMMCSLSIPIITLCALILLIIIVTLLDFIFKWLPFLIVCFPLPGLRAKDE
jgi:hypothetical protein